MGCSMLGDYALHFATCDIECALFNYDTKHAASDESRVPCHARNDTR